MSLEQFRLVFQINASLMSQHHYRTTELSVFRWSLWSFLCTNMG